MSNRSLAAARSRRSPQEVVSEASLKKNQQMPPQKRPGMPPSKDASPGSATNNKLSIGDAIGLITIRLSKLEAHMMKEQNEIESTISTSGGITDVDTVLRSLVSRVSGLEKSSENVEQHLGDLEGVIKELEENTERPESISGQPDPILLERLDKAEKEISELKLLVIKLQTMLIETTLSAKTQIVPQSTPQQSIPSPLPSPPYHQEESTGSMVLEI